MSPRKRRNSLVAKTELLTWIGGLVARNLQSIALLADCTAYAEVFNLIYGSDEIPLSKLNYHCKTHEDRERNGRWLQRQLERLRIPFRLETEKLASNNFACHHATLQYIFNHFELNGPKEIPDPARTRRRRESAALKSAQAAARATREYRERRASIDETSGRSVSPPRGEAKQGGLLDPVTEELAQDAHDQVRNTQSGDSQPAGATDADLRKDEHHRQQLMMMTPLLENELRAFTAHQQRVVKTVKLLTREREFYMAKLKEMERFAKQHKGSRAAEAVQRIVAKVPPDFTPVVPPPGYAK